MANSNLKEVKKDPEMDMTPMIDCVFLLMIFFVLVIDLSQKDLEDLILPKAEYAEPDEDPADTRPVANILQDGTIRSKGKTYYEKKVNGDNFKVLSQLMFDWKKDLERAYLMKDMTIEDIRKNIIKQEKVGGGMVMTVIDEPVLVRADKWTDWYFVGKLMAECTNPKAAFWKLELALSEEDKESKLPSFNKGSN